MFFIFFFFPSSFAVQMDESSSDALTQCWGSYATGADAPTYERFMQDCHDISSQNDQLTDAEALAAINDEQNVIVFPMVLHKSDRSWHQGHAVVQFIFPGLKKSFSIGKKGDCEMPAKRGAAGKACIGYLESADDDGNRNRRIFQDIFLRVAASKTQTTRNTIRVRSVGTPFVTSDIKSIIQDYSIDNSYLPFGMNNHCGTFASSVMARIGAHVKGRKVDCTWGNTTSGMMHIFCSEWDAVPALVKFNHVQLNGATLKRIKTVGHTRSFTRGVAGVSVNVFPLQHWRSSTNETCMLIERNSCRNAEEGLCRDVKSSISRTSIVYAWGEKHTIWFCAPATTLRHQGLLL